MCEDCGRPFSVRARALRAIRAGDRSERCGFCIHGSPLVVTDELRRWWLERFSMEEIRLMGRAIEETAGAEWRSGFLFLVPGAEQAA